MKNTLLYQLALFVCIPMTLICMNNDHHDNGIIPPAFLEELLDNKRPKTPPVITMQRVSYDQDDDNYEEETARKRVTNSAFIALIEEHVPHSPSITLRTSPFKDENQPSEGPTPKPGDDSGSSDEELSEPNTIILECDPQEASLFEKSKLRELPKTHILASAEIDKISLDDGIHQQQRVGDRSLADTISSEQKLDFKLYDQFTPVDELVDAFLTLKKKISTTPFEQRQKLIEYQQSTFIYYLLLQKLNKDKKKVKALLCGLADYESDEEDIHNEGFKYDGSDTYRLAKNILTYTFSKLEKRVASAQANVDNLNKEQNTLIEQIKKLKQAKKATNLSLQKEIKHTHDLENAQSILNSERENHRKYLTHREDFLKEAIKHHNAFLAQLSADNEEAIINQDIQKQKELKTQRKATEADLDKAKAALATLEYNMTNFDTPTGEHKLLGGYSVTMPKLW